MHVSQQEVERIAHYLDVQAETDRADLAFVFGTRLLEPAYLALDLLQRHVVEYVVLTGGTNRLTGVNEARAHLQILTEAGAPRDRILVEDASTNTLENVVLALPKIAATIGLERLKTVIVITKWYHARRAIMTLKRHLPLGVRYYTRTYEPPGLPREAWHLNDAARQMVLGNWQRIPEYLRRGHLAEIHRAGDAFI